MSKQVVVSFADGAGNYAKAMMRLEQSLRSTEFNGEFKGINDYAHINADHHQKVPYQFKAMSIKKVIDEGAKLVLWCDSPVYATKSIQPVFDHIKQHGYLLFDNIGYSIGDYTSDACLQKFGMSRDEAFKSKMLMACVLGFNVDHPKAQDFLNKYIGAAKDGVSYPGSWTNDNLEVSTDMRVRGHRHDQSVASIIAKQLGMEITNAQQTFFAYKQHSCVMPITDTVSLWSQGI